MDPMVSCVQLDRLSQPKKLGDTQAYSKLALQTGVDYLVTGRVAKQGGRLRITVAVYSADKPDFRNERIYECAIERVLDTSAEAAKAIAKAIGAVVAKSVVFESDELSEKAIELLDRSVELCTGCERDRSDVGDSCRIAMKASLLHPGNQMLAQWARSYYLEAPKGLDGYREIRKRSMRNFSIRRGGVRPGTKSQREWWAFDRSSNALLLDAAGKPIISKAWRNNVNSYRFRMQSALPGQGDVYRLVLRELCDRYPNSAYMKYNSSGYLARLGEWDESLAASKAAVELNPQSYRLQMDLVRAYLCAEKNQEASHKLDSALDKWPERSECHLLAAVLYRRWKQYDRAADELLTVQQFDPQAEGLHDLLARDYMHSGKVVEAVREMARADDTLRRGMITFSAVLSGVFVVVAVAIGLLAYLALRPERSPRR